MLRNKSGPLEIVPVSVDQYGRLVAKPSSGGLDDLFQWLLVQNQWRAFCVSERRKMTIHDVILRGM